MVLFLTRMFNVLFEKVFTHMIGPVSKLVSWCFTPSQPVRLYQGDTHLILYIYVCMS